MLEAAGGGLGLRPFRCATRCRATCPRNWKSLSGIVMAHARRRFVEVTPNFPLECRFVLESLGEVYGYDEAARAQRMSPEQRLRFHQEHSGPVMEKLRIWLDAQFDERRVEPNSGLGTSDILLTQTLGQTYSVSAASGSAAG